MRQKDAIALLLIIVFIVLMLAAFSFVSAQDVSPEQACPLCGKQHNGDIIDHAVGVIHSILSAPLQWIEKIGRTFSPGSARVSVLFPAAPDPAEK